MTAPADAYSITELAALLGGTDRSLVRRWVLGARLPLAGWERPPLLPATRDDRGRWVVPAVAVHRWLDDGATERARGLYRGELPVADPDRRLLTVTQTAAVLRVSVRTVRAHTARGELGCIRPAGLHRQFIPLPCLRAYIDARRRSRASEDAASHVPAA
jgi:excisionase family DNA binding protein